MRGPLHDPIAMAIAIDPTIGTVDTSWPLETQGGLTRARRSSTCTTSWASRPTPGSRSSIDVERFWARMIAAIAALAA